MNVNKPSYKTLEFWLSAVAVIVGLLISSGILPSDSEAMKIAGFISSTLVALGYTGARTMQKNSAVNSALGMASIAANKDKPVNP